MTTRELSITKAVLDYLHSLDGGQSEAILIHREVHGAVDPSPSAAEVNVVIAECDAQGWIAGVPARFTKKMKWNITDLGESARIQLHQ